MNCSRRISISKWCPVVAMVTSISIAFIYTANVKKCIITTLIDFVHSHFLNIVLIKQCMLSIDLTNSLVPEGVPSRSKATLKVKSCSIIELSPVLLLNVASTQCVLNTLVKDNLRWGHSNWLGCSLTVYTCHYTYQKIKYYYTTSIER